MLYYSIPDLDKMSESDCDCPNSDDDRRMDIAFLDHNFAIINPHTSDDVFEHWGHISIEDKKKAGHLMKICAFWLPILLQRDESNTITCWAAQVGLVEPHKDLSLKHIHKIEILEAILRALEKGTFTKDQTKHIIWISNRFYLHSPEVLEDALHWLEKTEEPNIRQRVLEFGHLDVCFKALHLIFVEFAQYVKAMAINFDKTMSALTARPPDMFIKRSEEMKRKGNEHFQKRLYEDAVKFYSKAIKYYPDNHIIYGNRALCFIKCNNYLKAVGDGKRATLIKPFWAKGHYRYCEALFKLGEVRMALEANNSAQSLCKEDTEGIKDLEQQHQKFTAEIAEAVPQGNVPRLSHTKEANTTESKPPSVKSEKKPFPVRNAKGTEVKVDKHTQPGNNNSTPASAQSVTKEVKSSKSGLPLNSGKAESSINKKSNETGQCEKENLNVLQRTTDTCKEFCSIVRDAFTALDDLRSRNAEQAFSQALALLETTSPKVLCISTMDILLLHYGRATALTEIGRPEELSEALRVLEKIQSFKERTFQCLVYLAFGRVYVKENRYKAALKHFSDSLQMLRNQITPGKLTWPLTKELVRETQPEYLMESLEKAIELCRFPPIPDAICRLEKCIGSVKSEIYFTDPDFKGFIRIHCCKSCRVEYHITCWKSLKTLSFLEKNEKDFLQDRCLTPDCVGQINGIKIFGPTGLLKCKFDVAIPEPQAPKKPRVNQKCTSLKKLKSKEEHRLRRKHNKQLFQDKQTVSNETVLQTEDSATQAPQKAWLHFRDHVLLQVSQHMALLREERTVPVSALTTSLKPWLELDRSRGNHIAGKMLNWLSEPLETLGQAVELLLERRNRVWARVLIYVLSNRSDIHPKLSSWACQLNNAGLNAAQYFIERYAEQLEQLDLSLLLSFSPLQEIIIEKLDSKPEFFSSLGLTVTEYLKQSAPHDMRLFIWTLEEHRDQYVSCQTILDEYFDMMDGLCSVLKKSEENKNKSPIKSKNRGKKKNQQKAVVWPGMSGVTREEWDQDYFEDDSLLLLPDDPFSVPSHLQERVASFEEQYSKSRIECKTILDNNPDPTKESLYGYFAQILEEHGPLVAEDPLLVGELKNFPAKAQQKIQMAGGFEAFLLGSLRFIKIGRRIGLAKSAVNLQQAEQAASLDDLDFITDTDNNSPSVAYDNTFLSYLKEHSSAQTDMYPILPNPYVYDLYPSPNTDLEGSSKTDVLPSESKIVDSGPPAPFTLAICNDEPTVGHHGDTLEPTTGRITTEKEKPAPIQNWQKSLCSVGLNTEPNQHLESCHGDINNKEKTNRDLKKQINAMAKECSKLELQHKECINSLEEDLQKTTACVQVTEKELAMFQHKLEEEVRKDQKEKKEHQELLKSLRLDMEQLLQEQDSLTRNIRDKKSKYEAQLSDFLELSNQSAAERMSLEDEIKRCKGLVTRANRRSLTAQLSVVESSRDQGLYNLYRELADNKAVLRKLDEVASRFPTQDLEATQNSIRLGVQEIENKISSTETHYMELMGQVKNGTRISELQPVNSEDTAEVPSAQISEVAKDHLNAPPSPQPSEEVSAGPGKRLRKHPTKAQELAGMTVLERVVERLAVIFPGISRSELMMIIQKFRSNSGSLNSMVMQDVVSGVSQLILDQQEEQTASGSSSAMGVTCPLGNSASAWQPLEPHRAPHSKALNIEDPCIICHEDMSPEEICVLECRHSFHKECIRSWLKEQSTCPTCRDHTLLPEDFPVLSGRRHL